MLSLNSVSTVKLTNEEGAFIVTCNVTDDDGSFDFDYCARRGDDNGLNPAIIQWIDDHPDFPRQAYVAPLPPTAEELRAQMQPITARQLKLTLVRNGITLASVKTAIDAIADELAGEEALIEWESAGTFRRLHPTLLMIADAFALSPERVDELWAEAAAIE